MDRFLETVALPYRCLSLSQNALVETPEQVKDVVMDYSHTIRSFGAEHLVPRLQMGRRLGSDYLEGIYEVHSLGGTTQPIPPYDARAVYARRGAGWRMIETERHIVTTGWMAGICLTQGSGTDSYPGFAKGDMRGLGQSPRAIYQGFLDALSQAERIVDFDGYMDLLHLPVTAHRNRMDTTFCTLEDCRAFFDMMCKTHSGDISDTLERRADKAELLGADLLVGYHTVRTIKDGVDVVDPVSSRMALKFVAGAWRLISVANTLTNTSYPFDMYQSGATLPTDLDIQKRTLKCPNSQPQ